MTRNSSFHDGFLIFFFVALTRNKQQNNKIFKLWNYVHATQSQVTRGNRLALVQEEEPLVL